MDNRIKEGFSEAWRLYDHYFETAPDDAERWHDMVSAAAEIGSRYSDQPVVTEFLTVILKDIDRRSEQMIEI